MRRASISQLRSKLLRLERTVRSHSRGRWQAPRLNWLLGQSHSRHCRKTASKDGGVTRDELGCALFKAGFENSLIWAGRSVLRAEARRMKWFAALLPNSTLGAGDPSPDNRRITLSVVVPVYNEKPTFRDVMEHLLAKEIDGVDIEICLVESNSKDGTRDNVLAFAAHPRVKLLLEEKPSGKGHAVRAGLNMASGDIVLIQDADLEYDLGDYERLISPIRAGETSFILGARHHETERHDWKIRHFEDATRMSNLLNYGHLFFTWFLNVLFLQRLRDPFTRYRCFAETASTRCGSIATVSISIKS